MASTAQKNTLSVGLNITHFNDWKNGQFLNFFNPEVGYSKKLNKDFSISTSLDGFYGESLKVKERKEGSVTYRLIFSNDVLLEYHKNGFFTGVGPTIRYRKERVIKYFYPQPNPFEVVYGPNPATLDFGGAVKAGYDLKLSRRNFLRLKLSYKLYNKGVNPVSFGVLYGWSWD
ncbi:MAG TPA: hypothetical protein VF622_01180 [Segetibacter sp.]|jgi:hypothetical protein